MDVKIEEGWKKHLSNEFEKPYFKALTERVRHDYADPSVNVYPPGREIFAAFDASPFNDTKVVIIGQDPYHGPGQANGLCFSVAPGVPFPPSLLNIFKEVNADTGAPIPTDGDLSRWARQGVLLLNSSLTVKEHQPKSHSGIGWETFTDAAVNALSENRDNIVFLLWGSDAIRKGAKIDRNRHLVLTSPHPSPLSAHRGFFGNHHFSKANQYLVAHGKSPIIW
ncbi:MAG: uracil-DNA glycosylase [Muribaculaceae bacterium]|nr:uracil-DNA glycosylase [Muribaculaceae bacterium]